MSPNRGRGRSEHTESLGSVLDSLAADRPLRSGLALGELGRRWEDVVGEQLAKECYPGALDGGLLVVRASSAAWAAQVKFLADGVRERTNGVLGFDAVRAVRVAVEEARKGS